MVFSPKCKLCACDPFPFPAARNNQTWFYVPVENLCVVQSRESPGDLVPVLPHEILGDGSLEQLMLLYDLGQVPIGRILHDDAQAIPVQECLVVADDVGMLKRRDVVDVEYNQCTSCQITCTVYVL